MKRLIKYFINRIFLFLPAIWISHFVRKIPVLSKAVPPGKEITLFGYRGAFQLHLDPKFTIDRDLLNYGYETGICDLIAKLVALEDVCVDAGANIGVITFVMAKAAGKAGKVYAFEPGPDTHARLLDNLRLNPGWKNVIVPIAAGLGEQESMLLWRGDGFDGGNGRILADDKALSGDGVQVKVTTLDRFAEDEGLQRLDFMKIDVEGMEIDVLRGGRETIRRLRPKILLETLKDFSEIRQRDLLGEIKEFFDEMGYILYRVGDNMPIKSVSDFGMNTLALPAEKSGQWTVDGRR